MVYWRPGQVALWLSPSVQYFQPKFSRRLQLCFLTNFIFPKYFGVVDLGEPTAFLNHVYLGCTQRECKPNENVACKYKEMFESRISAAANEKLPGWEKPHAKTVAWSFDMEGHARKCMDRYCELAHKKTEQLYKVSSPCQDDRRFEQEELETIGELSNVCSQNCLKCLYSARIVRPDIHWSVHKMDKSL